MTPKKIRISIPFLSPIGTKSTTKIKLSATNEQILNFAGHFTGFYGEGVTRVKKVTDYSLGG